MLVALHVLYAALGFIDPPEQEDTEASHFAHQSWSISPSHQVGFSSSFKDAYASSRGHLRPLCSALYCLPNPSLASAGPRWRQS